MRIVGEQLVTSATDLATYMGCGHATALDKQVALKLLDEPDWQNTDENQEDFEFDFDPIFNLSDGARLAARHTDTRRQTRHTPKPASGRIAIKVFNQLGDKVMKMHRVTNELR